MERGIHRDRSKIQCTIENTRVAVSVSRRSRGVFWTSLSRLSSRYCHSNVSVSSRSRDSNVSVSSRYCHSNVSVSSRSRHPNVSVSSQSRDSNVSVSSRSWHHTSNLHRNSKFKIITKKFLFFRDRYRMLISRAYLCREWRFFVCFSTMNCLTLALKTWVSWTRLRNWFVLISASRTTDNISKWKHDYYRHSLLRKV